jgi:predicted pyridoxine 5'-phosphate oxidase superfamily flavin-nucleotide-binding protein
MYQPKFPIRTAAEVKAILGPDFPMQVAKVIDHIDQHCQAWIERCPFIVISSISASGAMDTSPKGDPPGFVKVPDLALIVHVKEAFFHCGKAMIRSGMWEPEKWGSIDGLPSYAQALKSHGNLPNDLAELEEGVADNASVKSR